MTRVYEFNNITAEFLIEWQIRHTFSINKSDDKYINKWLENKQIYAANIMQANLKLYSNTKS